jgi:iron complex transport system substrate-binding protein
MTTDPRPARRWRTLAAAIAVPALALALTAGCGSDDSDDDGGSGGDAATRVFAADNGDIEIPVDPRRVVATGYAVPVLIEADAALVGISSWKRGLALMSDEDLETYEDLEQVAGEVAAETNYEAIDAVEPDLIVIGVPKPALADLDMERLESIAPVVVIGPTVPSAWRTLAERQADAAGRSENFGEARDAYKAKAAQLKEKYADVLADMDFGHLGGYGQIAAGSFHREYAGSWGTNIAGDIGVQYPGEPTNKEGGALDVSEYPAIEELASKYADVDAITYTVQPDGTPTQSVQYVLDSELWKNLPAVQSGMVFPIRYTEAATYETATQTLDELDQKLATLLAS